VTNWTFSGNTARAGGGIYFDNAGSLAVDHCTIVSNVAAPGLIPARFGGGIANFTTGIPTGIRISIGDTIVAGNAGASGPDVYGGFTSGGYNLIGRGDNSTGLTNGVNHDMVGSLAAPTNALVGPLQDNGGPTPTHALLSGSPAIDQGISAGLASDQRGAQRPFDLLTVANAAGGDGTDIGAYEIILPRLGIQLVVPNVVLSWTTYAPGFTLYSNNSLANSGGWTPVPGVPAIVGSQYNEVLPVTPGGVFFRLRSP
jgi:predicted outer membrane repeat protein